MRCEHQIRRIRGGIAVFAIFLVGATSSGCNTGLCLRKSDCADFLTCAPEGDCVVPPDAAMYDRDGNLIIPDDAHVDAKIDADTTLPLAEAGVLDAGIDAHPPIDAHVDASPPDAKEDATPLDAAGNPFADAAHPIDAF